MKLHYRLYGEGPPLIIVHGLLGSGGNWHSLASGPFAPHFSVYTVDQRNHGRSPHDDRFDYPSMVADLVEFLDDRGIERAHLLGHSMGGKTVMHFALDHPERTDRLIVADLAPRAYEDRHSALLDALGSVDLARVHSRSDADRALAAEVSSPAVRQFLLKNLDHEDGQYRWQMNLYAIARHYAGLNDPVEEGRTFDGPALFIRGEHSDYLRDNDLPSIRALFPRAELVTLERAGHWLHADAPEAFAGAVLDFLR
jgi:esterase